MASLFCQYLLAFIFCFFCWFYQAVNLPLDRSADKPGGKQRKNIVKGIDNGLNTRKLHSVNVPALVSLFIKAPFSSSFLPARDDAGTSERLEQIGAFCFVAEQNGDRI